MKKILIIGASTTGAIIANKLARDLRDEIAKGKVSITALDKSECCTINQAGYTFVPFGFYAPEDLIRPIKKVISPRVNVKLGKKGETTKIDVDNQVVEVASGDKYEYDYLVIATGAVPDPSKIKGMSKDFLSFYTSLDDAKKVGEIISKFDKGRIVVFTVKMPIPCPGAPGKFTVLLDDYLRYVRGEEVRKNIEIHFVWPIKSIGPPAYNEVITPVLENKGVKIYREFEFDHVDENSKEVVSASGERVKYDLLITVPPYRCADFLVNSGLTDEKGWVPADKRTLQYVRNGKKVENVFVVGDSGPALILKTGVSAHYESFVVAQNIANEILGNRIKIPYRGETGCPIVTSSYTEYTKGRAYLATWTYGMPLKKFMPTEFGWYIYRMYYYLYWDMTIKAIM